MKKRNFVITVWGAVIITLVLVNYLGSDSLYGPQRVFDTTKETPIYKPPLIIEPYDSTKVKVDTTKLEENDIEIEAINQGYYYLIKNETNAKRLFKETHKQSIKNL